MIFDEAHTLEAVAGDHLGLGVTSGQVQFLLNKLYNDRTNKGLLVTRKLREAQDLAVECHTRADELFDDASKLARRPGNRTGRILEPEPARKSAQSRAGASWPAKLRRAGQARSKTNRRGSISRRPTIGLTALAGELTHWIEQQSAGLRLLDRSRRSAARGRPRVGSRPRRSTSARSSASSFSRRRGRS